MLVAMVLAEDNVTIVPIVEGKVIRIYDTQTGESKDFPNPALGLTEGRRGAAVAWAKQQGVEVFCTPPGTLCELSYERAQKEKLRFYRLEAGTTFSTLQSLLENGIVAEVAALPKNEIEWSGIV